MYSDKVNFIHKYLAGEMTTSEKELFVNWLSEEKSNRQLFEEYSLIWEKSAQIQPIEFDYKKAYSAHLAILKKEDIKKTPIYSLPLFRAVAAIFVVVVGVFLVFNNTKKVVYSADDNSKMVVLEDQSKIWLEKGSQLIINSFNAKERVVSLSGKAFFEIHKNSQAPFHVQASNVNVEVVGTEFLVDSKLNTVDVKEGKVNVSHNSEVRTLIKNQSISVHNDHLTEIENKDFDNVNLWFNDDLTFDNVPLNIVLDEISKNFKIEFILPSKNDWSNCTFTSGPLKNNTIEQILSMLQLTYGLEYNKTEENTYKLSKIKCK